MNQECKEIAFVLEGAGKITIEGKEFNIKTEDMIVIEKGEKYFWEGEFKLFVYCSPAWFPEQHKHIEE